MVSDGRAPRGARHGPWCRSTAAGWWPGPRTTSPSASRKVLPCQGQVTQSWRICRRPAVRPCECRWHRSPGRRHLGVKQDRHPRSVDLPGRAVGRIRHGAHLCPRVWSRGPGGVVDVDVLDEGEVSAEVTADKQGCASPVAYQQGLSVLRNCHSNTGETTVRTSGPAVPLGDRLHPQGTYSDASPVSWGCGQRGLGQRSTGNRTGYGFRFGTGGHRRVTVDGIDTFYREAGRRQMGRWFCCLMAIRVRRMRFSAARRGRRPHRGRLSATVCEPRIRSSGRRAVPGSPRR